jgi:hypothetical protein
VKGGSQLIDDVILGRALKSLEESDIEHLWRAD